MATHAAVLIAAAGLLVMPPSIAEAQIRGRATVQPSQGWWISGGASAVVMNDITDGASQSKWQFGSDPLWQGRATIEKALDEFSSFGVAGGYGLVNVDVNSIATGANAKLPARCQVTCAATTQLWTGMLQFRSGGGEGFHTLFEGSAGATAFRDFRTRRTDTDSSASIAIAGIGRAVDLSGTLGIGFGYSLSRGFVVALVQDAGIGFHSKDNLPSGTGRTWRVRNTRASIRVKF